MSEKKTSISLADQRQLLAIAREAISAAANGHQPPELDVRNLPVALRDIGSCFVTLTSNGKLRGCIGSLEPSQPLAMDVQEHAVAAATQDYRFTPLQPHEEPFIRIEISRLTPIKKLAYRDSADLVQLLRPCVDGVVISDGFRRATFLPQVWEKISTPQDFLSQLCMKMGAPPEFWRENKLTIYTYQVEDFKE